MSSEICYNSIVDRIPCTSLILTTTTSHDPNIWNLFFILFLIGGIITVIVLFKYSKKPNDWRHKSVINDYYVSGRLKDLAESIKVTPVDYRYDSSLKKFIQTLFFQKIQSVRGLSTEEFEKLTKKDRKTMEEIIQDKEIVDWIQNVQRKQDKPQGLFKKGGMNKKEQYLVDLKSMVEKMEVWGE